jgi:nonspecific dipeptidase
MFEAIAEQSKPGKFLNDVDFFCISDNYWLGRQKPCITYGLHGLAYFEVSVQCSEQDLHSGVLGGTVHEAMNDLVHLMGSLVETGKPHVYLHFFEIIVKHNIRFIFKFKLFQT